MWFDNFNRKGSHKAREIWFFYLSVAMLYIYFLYSESSDNYYIAYSKPPERRVVEQITKEFNTFTKKHRPWKRVYSFPVSTSRSEGMKIEKLIKKQ